MRGGRSSRSERGFSMVEMMVSLTVLAITLSAVMSSVGAAQRLFYREKQVTQAIAIGETVTEGLLLLDASDNTLSLGEHSEFFNGKGHPTDEDHRVYTALWEVDTYDEVPGIRRIDLTIIWYEAAVMREVSWTTYRN